MEQFTFDVGIEPATPADARSHRFVDRTGWRNGNLIVLEFAGIYVKKNGSRESRWRCLCDCGEETFVVTGNWKRRTSCGCARRKPRMGRVLGEAAKDKLLREYQNGARTRGYAWELTAEDFYGLVAEDCRYCGCPPSKVRRNGTYNGEFVYNGIDRVDNSLGYVPGNVTACCETCNRAKNALSYSEFMAWIARLVMHHWFNPEQTPSRLLKEVQA